MSTRTERVSVSKSSLGVVRGLTEGEHVSALREFRQQLCAAPSEPRLARPSSEETQHPHPLRLSQLASVCRLSHLDRD
eukprot:1285689-Rhodomonas_salina.1